VEPSETKTRILDVTQELVQRLGANAISYQHVSDAVGIRKASIHHHFPTKDHLLVALLTRYSAYFLALVDQIIAAPVSPAKQLDRYVALFHATLREGDNDKACLCGMLGAELATLNAPAADLVRAFYQENERRLARILDRGLETGDFRFAGTARAAAALVFALLEGAVLIARARGGVAHFKTVTDQLTRLLSPGK
jgi:TetR/AcrR family transcriptional repressor of nem operon